MNAIHDNSSQGSVGPAKRLRQMRHTSRLQGMGQPLPATETDTQSEVSVAISKGSQWVATDSATNSPLFLLKTSGIAIIGGGGKGSLDQRGGPESGSEPAAGEGGSSRGAGTRHATDRVP